MKQYTAYGIVNGKAPTFDEAQKSLASHVEIQMARGWTPIGGVIFVGMIAEGSIPNFVFSQAIIKIPHEEEAK